MKKLPLITLLLALLAALTLGSWLLLREFAAPANMDETFLLPPVVETPAGAGLDSPGGSSDSQSAPTDPGVATPDTLATDSASQATASDAQTADPDSQTTDSASQTTDFASQSTASGTGAASSAPSSAALSGADIPEASNGADASASSNASGEVATVYGLWRLVSYRDSEGSMGPEDLEAASQLGVPLTLEISADNSAVLTLFDTTVYPVYDPQGETLLLDGLSYPVVLTDDSLSIGGHGILMRFVR